MDKFIKWSEVEVKQIRSAFKGGNAILSECDTVLGLFTLATQDGFRKLNEIKDRKGKPYLMVISSPEEIKKFSHCNFDEHLQRLINYCWPGPLTLILKAKEDAPDYLKSTEGTIAIRVPKHEFLLNLLKATGPLFSTSANIAGQPVPGSLKDVASSILDQATVVIANDTDVGSSAVPSTILDCSSPNKIILIREGAYDVDTLERISGGKILR